MENQAKEASSPIPKYPDGNVYIRYRVTAKRGIEAVEIIAKRNGNMYLKNGEIRDVSGFYLEGSAKREWERLQPFSQKRKAIDERDARIWEAWISNPKIGKSELARRFGVSIAVITNALNKMSYEVRRSKE